MDEVQFTLGLALKLFLGLILLGVWLMAHQQAKLEAKDRRIRDMAHAEGRPEPARRVVSRSNRVIVIGAILFLIVVLLWGNESML